MKRREFNLSLAAATAVSLSPFSLARKARAAGGGATQVFNYADFSGTPGAVHLSFHSAYTGSGIQILDGLSHNGGNVFYSSLLAPGAFTTQFTFQFQGLGNSLAETGFCFDIQNTPSPPSAQGNNGLYFGGDANMCGYGGAINQGQAGPNALGIKFDAGNQNNSQPLLNYPAGGLPSSTGMYFNQGPTTNPGGTVGLCPINDLNPYGINFYTNHTYQVTIVYDGSLLTMVIADTVNGNQARSVWPLNLAATTNGSGNYVGFSSGSATNGPTAYIQSWAYWTGFNTRLSTPTFSPAPGNFTSAQPVSIIYPSGSTCYYTTNGLLPTSASTQYGGPITVSANQVLQAVAIQSGYTDSLVAAGNFVIGTSSNPINFPRGFSAGNLVPVGFAYLSGSTYRLTDNTPNTSGAVWFPLPVTVSSFSTAFTLDMESNAQGMAFVIQNNPPAYVALSGVRITGTSGQISFNATNISVGQYVTVAGTFGGTGSISGYNNTTTYIVGATNGTTTATLCGAGVASASQSGATFNTVPQSLVAGASVCFINPPGAFQGNQAYYVSSNGLSSTTCQISGTPGGSPISPGGSTNCIIIFTANSGGGGATLTTTAGTPSGLTFSVNAPNWTGGPTGLGYGSQGLGYGGLGGNEDGGQSFGLMQSVAVAFSQYAMGGDPSNGIGLYTNGRDPWGSSSATGLNFNTTFNVTLSYNGTTLSISMQATGGGTTFTRSWPINIPSTVGGQTAYVGFTGGSGGGAHAVQAVQSWTYTAAGSTSAGGPPAPAAPTNLQVK